MPLWLLVLAGRAVPGAYLAGPFWHAHEMLFGFTLAVVAGFLLTAIANWTQRETAVGWPLAALAGLWIAGRVAILAADRLPAPLVALLDLAFVPALAAACARPIVLTANRRNYQFVAMLAALFLANLAMHLGALGVAPAWLRRGGVAAVDLYVVMILVVTGRIVPMFTRNATRVDAIRGQAGRDRLAVGGAVAVLALDVLGVAEPMVAAVAGATAVAVVARAATWGARHTARHPLLWILHGGHLWVAIGLALRAVAPWMPALGGTVALHALTVGGIGGLTLGMMTRVTLGHTGRPLRVPPIVARAFAAMLAAALVRVAGPLLGPAAWLPSMIASGGLFAAAFAIYLVTYVPMLLAPRPDGRPG
jgi:uncharacterized protein involved in response to NO